MTKADIEATQAPLMDHLIELRARLIKALLAFVVMFFICFFFAKNIYNILLMPYEHAAGPDARLIYTAPQEYLFTADQGRDLCRGLSRLSGDLRPALRLCRAGAL